MRTFFFKKESPIATIWVIQLRYFCHSFFVTKSHWLPGYSIPTFRVRCYKNSKRAGTAGWQRNYLPPASATPATAGKNNNL